MKRFCLCVSVAFAICLSAWGQAESAPASGPASRPVSFRLDNGLRVTLRPHAPAKIACVLVMFDLGGDHDPAGKSGFGHLVEHLYVTAAAGALPARTAAEWMGKYALPPNAQTGDDYTVIAAVVKRDQVAGELTDAAARMGDLHITEADLVRERPRMEEELTNMFGAMPALAVTNHGRELARPTAAGGRKGGRPEMINALTLEAVTARWREWYKPANAHLVVVGGFDSDAVRAQITREFGSIAAGTRRSAPTPASAPMLGALKVAPAFPTGQTRPGQNSWACLTWVAPPPMSEDYPAFLAMTAGLSWLAQTASRPASRPNAVDTKPMVLFMPIDDPSCLQVRAAMAPGETPQAAIARLDAFVAKGADRCGPDQGAAARMNYAWLLGTINYSDKVQMMNPYGLAFRIARSAQLGIDGEKLGDLLDQVTAVSLARVRAQLTDPSRRAACVLTVDP